MLQFNCSIQERVFNLSEPGRYLEQFLTIQVGNVSGHDYQKYEKCLDSRVTYMTCDEYLWHCVNDIFHSTWDKTVGHIPEPETIHRLAQLMARGTPMGDIPYLNYATNNQEGRHRALAFKECFGADAKMPVVEIFKTKATLEEIYAYCYRKFQNQNPESSAKWYIKEIAPRHGYSTKEIYAYLGIPYEEEPEEDDEDEEPEWDYDKEVSDDILLDDGEGEDDYEKVIVELAKKYNMSLSEVDALDSATFTKLVDKMLGW